jgi:hypothetical protein
MQLEINTRCELSDGKLLELMRELKRNVYHAIRRGTDATEVIFMLILT